MGITAKRVCGVCGKTVGTLSAIYVLPEMRDDSYLCGECLKRCSPNIAFKAIRTWTAEDAVYHMEFMHQQRESLQSIFHETDSVKNMKGEKLISVDEKLGWWYAPSAAPDIFKLDQVAGWQLHLQIDDSESSGIHMKYTPPRPDMPAPGRMEELDGMTMTIKIKNHPYVEEVELKIAGGRGLLEGYRGYLNNTYKTALDAIELLERHCKATTGDIAFF